MFFSCVTNCDSQSKEASFNGIWKRLNQLLFHHADNAHDEEITNVFYIKQTQMAIFKLSLNEINCEWIIQMILHSNEIALKN